jgi:hypothetical protein
MSASKQNLTHSQYKHLEYVFTNFMLTKIGPNDSSEIKRAHIYSQIKLLIERAMGIVNNNK